MSTVEEATPATPSAILKHFSSLAPAYSYTFEGVDLNIRPIKPTLRDEQCIFLKDLFKGDYKEPFYIDTDIWSVCYLSHNLDVIFKFKPGSSDGIKSIKLHFF